MTDQRIHTLGDDLAAQTGNGAGAEARSGLGGMIDERRAQAGDALNQYKGKALGVYGQAMDKLDSLVVHAPAGLQERARSTIAVARRKPLLTTAIVAGLGLLLLRSGRRR